LHELTYSPLCFSPFPGSLGLLFQHTNLAPLDLNKLSRRERTNRTVQATLDAPGNVRGRVEAIANSVIALAEKRDLAERALREVCQADGDLLDVLERDVSLEERIFAVWLKDAHALDRARNVAQGYGWRCGRYHCGFDVKDAGSLSDDFEIASETVGGLIQQMQGGRKVSLDHFTYVPEDGSADAIHHFAVYLETPASFIMEFGDGEDFPLPVVRREAREVAIDYNPKSGRLDIAGRGIGGFRVFDRVARAFCQTALSDAEFVAVTRPEWNLAPFLNGVPSGLTPPASFSTFRITEIATTSVGGAGGQLVLRAPKGIDIYEHAKELGICLIELPPQYVRSIAITLTAVPTPKDTEPREFQISLAWPNGRSFDGATFQDQMIVEPWLESRQFHLPQ
jgi:hypothetical protein